MSNVRLNRSPATLGVIWCDEPPPEAIYKANISRYNYLKELGIPEAYLFAYTIGSNYQKWATKTTDGSYRMAFRTLTEPRKFLVP